MQSTPFVRACLAAAVVLPAACTAIHPATGPASSAPATPATPATTTTTTAAADAPASLAVSEPEAAVALAGPEAAGPLASYRAEDSAHLDLAELAQLVRPTSDAVVRRADQLVGHLFGLELDVQASLRRAESSLAGLARQVGLAGPDLTVLSMEPVARTESSGFGWRDDPIRHTRKFHSGTDFRGQPGTPVRAAGDGVVVFCGRLGGYGNVIDIDHGGGILTRYAHLRRFETKKDAAVTAGTAIGEVGSTGRTTGPHLHFEVRIGGAPVSPIAAMTVAALQRESPLSGQLAALALAPELQSAAESTVDPPRQRGRATQRPERSGRDKRKQVLW